MKNCMKILLALFFYFNSGVLGSDKNSLGKMCEQKHSTGKLFEHPSDCNKFVQCSHGNAHEKSCARGLWFAPTLGICDYKANVYCKGNPCNKNNGGCHQKCSYINHNSYSCACNSGYKVDRNNNQKKCIQGSINMKTYCQGKHGQQLPDPRTCTGFIKCDGDVSVPVFCPIPLVYNEALQVCSWAFSTKCKAQDFKPWTTWSPYFRVEKGGECIRKRTRECSPGGKLCEGWTSEINVGKVEMCGPDEAVNPCALQNGGCMEVCTNDKGNAVCSCGKGRYLASDKKSCTEGKCGVAPLRDDSIVSFIVNGQDTPKGSYPWQVAIYISISEDGQEESIFHCGGSLIDETHVLSAAHCFAGITEEEKRGVTVVLGEHDRGRIEGTEQVRKVEEIINHENFAKGTVTDDISLLTLSEKVTFTDYIQPICLPEKNEELNPGKSCRITGWGKLFHGEEKAEVLQEITVPVVAESECKKKNKFGLKKVTNKMICTGYDDGLNFKSACHGDSGGPLSCMIDGQWKLYGIVSWGDPQCNIFNEFNKFTKVAKYTEWIQQTRS